MEAPTPSSPRLVTRLVATRPEVAGVVLLAVAGAVLLAVLWWWQRPDVPGAQAVAGPPVLAPAEVVVHVTGAVLRPGVVRVGDGARVVDVLALAGGASPDADLGALNLARLVVDGEQVAVPTRAAVAAVEGGPAPPGAWDDQGRLDLNLATVDDLEQLPGVGPVLAARIVRHREANGPFTQVGELRAVSGIGEKTFQALADLVVV